MKTDNAELTLNRPDRANIYSSRPVEERMGCDPSHVYRDVNTNKGKKHPYVTVSFKSSFTSFMYFIDLHVLHKMHIALL